MAEDASAAEDWGFGCLDCAGWGWGPESRSERYEAVAAPHLAVEPHWAPPACRQSSG